MSHVLSMARRSLASAAFVVGLIASSASPAFAAYRVWFFDTVYETYEIGDITAGSSPLYVAPGWACTMRINDPSYYRWVNEYGGTISDADGDHHITIGVSNPGCPGFTVRHGNQPLLPPEGASYLEISTGYGHDWLDVNGGWPDCGNCVVADEVTNIQRHTHSLDSTLQAHRTVSEAVLNARTQAGVGDTIASLAAAVARLRLSVSQEVAARRRIAPLADREKSIRVLEDAALRTLATAKRQLDSCALGAREWRFDDAFLGCTLGGHGLEAARSLLHTLQFTFERR